MISQLRPQGRVKVSQMLGGAAGKWSSLPDRSHTHKGGEAESERKDVLEHGGTARARSMGRGHVGGRGGRKQTRVAFRGHFPSVTEEGFWK